MNPAEPGFSMPGIARNISYGLLHLRLHPPITKRKNAAKPYSCKSCNASLAITKSPKTITNIYKKGLRATINEHKTFIYVFIKFI